MISVDEALARVLALAAPLPAEQVSLRAAAGRVLAEPAIATRAQPPFDAAAMDGYAMAAPDARAGARLRVAGTSRAGAGFDGPVAPGEAVRIFTGAPMPAGLTHVVIQEDAEAEGDSVLLREVGAANMRPAAADFAAGDSLAAPRRLRPADLALLAAMNLPELSVHRRPVVALIATGDELVMPGEAPGRDQIVASNLFALAAMAEAEGARVRLLPIARDTNESLATVLGLAEGADVIVTIGGASVGAHDLVGSVAEGMGLERAFWKIAMRPGKPLMAGRLGGALLLGLPGNPVSAIVCGHLFLLPALRALQGLPDPAPRPLPCRLGCDLPENGPRTHYMRARRDTAGSPPTVTPFDRQDSSLLSILSEADALLIRPAGDAPRPAGAAMAYLPI